MPKGWNDVKRRIRRQKKERMQVIAIKHYKDLIGDDYWQPSAEKPHYHITVRIVRRGKDNRIIPYHVETILKALGIVFRKEEDKVLWNEHGVETIENYAHMAVYLNHDTIQAELDGKAKYALKDLVSNLTIEEIEQIRAGYVRVSEGNRKVGTSEMATIDEQAYELGQKLEDFNLWYASLDFAVRSHSKMKTVKESYYRGIEDRVKMDGRVNRLCVFIKGGHNLGKGYAALEALKGKRYLTIEGGGTGKFDRLSPSDEAIIVNDDKCPNLLNMTDNYMCQAYKRQKDNPYWCGEYFIVTSNKSFAEWLRESGIDVGTFYSDGSLFQVTEHYRAMKSRFYICHIENIDGVNKLICDSPSTRGTEADQMERKAKYMDFRKKYNASLAEYKPNEYQVDYSNLNDE